MLFFGCIKQAGHFLWETETRRAVQERHLVTLDGRFVPSLGDHDALIHLHGAWGSPASITILAFTDYTVDARPGSNGMFIETGTLSRTAMIRRASRAFPNVLRRVRPSWVPD